MLRKKEALTPEQSLKKWKRRFFLLLSAFLAFVSAAGFYIYLNYDYLVFKHFIAQNYIYTGMLDKLFDNELKTDIKGRYYTYFDDLVISVVTRRIRETGGDRYTYLYTPGQFIQYKQEEKSTAEASVFKAISSDTAYIRLTNFSTYTRNFLFDNVANLKKYPKLIIDLRDNPGGDLDAMNAMAGLFLPKGSVITTDRLRLLNWTYRAKGGQALKFDKIAILMNKNTASASECFIGALKDNLDKSSPGKVVLIGGTSYGKGIGQYTLPLKKGFAAKATVMNWFTPQGYSIHGKGFTPDIPYAGEDILDFALRNF